MECYFMIHNHSQLVISGSKLSVLFTSCCSCPTILPSVYKLLWIAVNSSLFLNFPRFQMIILLFRGMCWVSTIFQNLFVTGRTEERRARGDRRLKHLDSLCELRKDNMRSTQLIEVSEDREIASHSCQCRQWWHHSNNSHPIPAHWESNAKGKVTEP